MPKISLNPNSLRYLKAQLAPFLKPMVWAPAAILSITVGGVWDFVMNPKDPAANTETAQVPGSQFLNPNDQGILADIDNTSVLRNALGINATANSGQSSNQLSQPLLGSGVSSNRATVAANPITSQPIGSLFSGLTQPGQILTGGTVFGSTVPIGTNPFASNLSSSPLPNAFSSGQSGLVGQNTPLPANVLQQALNASLQQSTNSASSSNSLLAPAGSTTASLSSQVTGAYPTQPTSSGFPSLPTLPGQPTQSVGTATSGATGSTTPPLNSYTGLVGTPSLPTIQTTVPAAQSSINPFSATPVTPSAYQLQGGGTPIGGGFPTPPPTPQPVQATPSPAPPPSTYIVAPGRYLGGGQINTFSNPLGTGSGN
ncbi:MAG: hypothetical protein KME16_16955 [Scytolyngbya sp. HA4215-MV1]|jgi:hypothetical protein|nr:hypothetical protein [Scytolyngbya sp. HA4215-MV1]